MESADALRSAFTLIEIVVALAVGVLLAAVVATVTANLSQAAAAVERQCRDARSERAANRILAADLRGLTTGLPIRQPKAAEGKNVSKKDPFAQLLRFEANQLRFVTLAAKTGEPTRPAVVHYQFQAQAGGGSLSRTERPFDPAAENQAAAGSQLTLLTGLSEGGFEYLVGGTWIAAPAEDTVPAAVRWRFTRATQGNEPLQTRELPPIAGTECIPTGTEGGS